MVYESDFYTTRRPYSSRYTPTISSYSVTTSIPSQITKYLPGVGKVYVVNNYQPHIPYVGHQRITHVPHTPIHVIRVRPSVIYRELDRIEHKSRPHIAHSYLDEYLNSRSAATFEEERKAIQAQTNSLMRRVHERVPRVTVKIIPVSSLSRYSDLFRESSLGPYSTYHITNPIRNVARDILNISYYPEPAKKYIGSGHVACVRYSGGKPYSTRKHMSDLTDHVIKNDINLLSYYLKSRQAAAAGDVEGPIKGLWASRPTRVFSTIKPLPDPADEKREVEKLKAAYKNELNPEDKEKNEKKNAEEADAKLKERKKRQEEEEERALLEEQQRQKEQAKRDEEERRKEAERQAELEHQRQMEEEAEREAQRIEKARKEAEEQQRKQEEDLKRQQEAEEELRRLEEEERLLREEEERLKQEEEERQKREQEQEKERERQQQEEAERIRQEELSKLEELARQAEADQEADLARQAEELAEIARQESELARKKSEEDVGETDVGAEAPEELVSPPAEAEDGVAEASEDEQNELPNESEPVVEEPQSPITENDLGAEVEEEEEDEEDEEEEEEE